ncbi:MAG: hypothetical protein QOK29_5512 [Rhodospirillaceae bacterium]|jgi:hypothetical protein|nr:hypothetical protein [Miltoncostaeaceae bacterium]MEA2783880.1 hypothetical protein [Rhodospirillaceae bacterium]
MPIERTEETQLFAAVTAAVLRTGADHLALVEPGSELIETLRSRALEIERAAEPRQTGPRRWAQPGRRPRRH